MSWEVFRSAMFGNQHGVNMRFQFPVLSFLVLLAVGASLAAEDASYMGKWKMNVAGSDFGEEILTYEQTPSQEYRVTHGGDSFTFRMDGKDYPSFDGRTAAWKQIDERTWGSTSKLDGKILWARTIKVSPDDKALQIETKGKNPDGTPFNDIVVYERLSGGTGLIGKWKTKKVDITPGVMELSPTGADGVIWTDSSMGSKVTAKFDGKDYPATGAVFGPGFTVALKKTGQRSFESTVKQEGKPLYRSQFVVSADGKTLTESTENVRTNERGKLVYDRQ